MPIIHLEHCFCCGKPIEAKRSGHLYCSTACQVFIHRSKERQAPTLSIADYRIQLIEAIRAGGYHPYKQNPINQIKRQINDLEYMITAMLPVVVD